MILNQLYGNICGKITYFPIQYKKLKQTLGEFVFYHKLYISLKCNNFDINHYQEIQLSTN